MSKLVTMALAAAAAMLAPTLASAQFESRSLYARGTWSVRLVHNAQEGYVMCVAETRNQYGQSFSIGAHQAGNPDIMVYDPSWNMSGHSAYFRVDIDYNVWNNYGWAEGSSVYVKLDNIPAGEGWKFIDDIMDGNAVAVYNDRGERISVFSLSGSAGAMIALIGCWDSIGIRRNSPF